MSKKSLLGMSVLICLAIGMPPCASATPVGVQPFVLDAQRWNLMGQSFHFENRHLDTHLTKHAKRKNVGINTTKHAKRKNVRKVKRERRQHANRGTQFASDRGVNLEGGTRPLLGHEQHPLQNESALAATPPITPAQGAEEVQRYGDVGSDTGVSSDDGEQEGEVTSAASEKVSGPGINLPPQLCEAGNFGDPVSCIELGAAEVFGERGDAQTEPVAPDFSPPPSVPLSFTSVLDDSTSPRAVPEPSTLMAMLAACAGGWLTRRRRSARG